MKALICGVSGQDGSYLAQLLLNKGYQLWGTSRDVQTSTLDNLKALSVDGQVTLLSMTPSNISSVFAAVEQSEPDEIYYLSGQSSVGLSFEQPVETMDSIVSGVLNLLEFIRLKMPSIRFFNASSSECFGDTGNTSPANELTPFRPGSPYAVAKASAHWLVANYREAYGLHASNGILFNHESPLRPKRFVTQKILQAAKSIAGGSGERLSLGRLDIWRDWGWAPEYVQAMWLMLQQEVPDDYVLATGEANSLADFVAAAFLQYGLDWQTHVDISQALFRPTDIKRSFGDPSKAAQILGWSPNYRMREVIAMM